MFKKLFLVVILFFFNVCYTLSQNKRCALIGTTDFTISKYCVGLSSTFNDITPNSTTCNWDFGDLTNGSGKSINHTYTAPGQYIVKQTVSDGICSNTITRTITILGSSITFSPSNTTICIGSELKLEAKAAVNGNYTKKINFSSTGVASTPIPKGGSYDASFNLIGVKDNWDGSIGTGTNSTALSNVGFSSFAVTGLTPMNWKIDKITVTIKTSKAKNITAFIESPCGGRIKLIERTSGLSGASGFESSTFTPDASVLISGNTPIGIGPFAASELSLWSTNLLGCINPNGTWKLIVGEWISSTSSGNASIENWSIDFSTEIPNSIKSIAWSPTAPLKDFSYSGVSTSEALAKATVYQTQSITLTVKDEGGCTTSKKTSISVTSPGLPTSLNTSICSGTSTKLTATGNPNVSFTWYDAAIGGNILSNAASFTTPILTRQTSYWVTQTEAGCESDRKQVDVSMKNSIQADITCGTPTKNTVEFNWIAVTDAIDYTISYNLGAGIVTSNVSALTLPFSGLTFNQSIDLTITPNVSSGCPSPKTITCSTTGDCTPPVITSDPIPSVKCSGESTLFTITHTDGKIFQWQVSSNGGTSFSDLSNSTTYSGVDSPTLTISDVTGFNTYLYRIKVTLDAGFCPIFSNSALLTVNEIPTATISGTTAICDGKSTDLNVTLTGKAPWEYNYSDGTTTNSKTNVLGSPDKITVSPSSSITYSLISLRDGNNCSGSISGTAIITLNPLPITSAILDTIICSKSMSNSYSFKSNPIGATFDWTNSDESIGLTSFGTGTIQVFEAQNNSTSPITSTIEITPSLAGCIGNKTQFNITVHPVFTTKITAIDSTMNSISFQWNAVNGASSYEVTKAIKTPQNPTLTFSSVSLPTPLTTTYTHGGLNMGDKVILNVIPKGTFGTCFSPANLISSTDSCRKATITKQPTSLELCFSESAVFSFNAEGNDSISGIQWQSSIDGTTWNEILESTPYLGVKTNELTISDLNGLNGTKYRAKILGTINACEIFTNAVDLIVSPSPTVNFEMDKKEGCAPLSILFTDKSGYPDANVTWDFGDGTTISKKVDMELNQKHTFQLADTFTVSFIVNRNGCKDTLQQKVYVKSPSTAKFSIDNPIIHLLDPTIKFTNLSSSNSVIYLWTFDDNSPISSVKNPTHTFDSKAGEYLVSLYTSSILSFDDTSCVDRYQQKITLLDDLIYYIPNAFTPNGDEFNNTFQPVFFSGFDPQHYYFSIYNRWGELIFESYNSSYGWDGSYGSRICDSGTFIWKLEFKEIQGEKQYYQTGFLNLIK